MLEGSTREHTENQEEGSASHVMLVLLQLHDSVERNVRHNTLEIMNQPE